MSGGLDSVCQEQTLDEGEGTAAMRTRTEIATRKQAEEIAPDLMRLLLPMTTAIAATKKGLMELVHRMGLAALDELLRDDAEKLAGRKRHREPGRERTHWGTTPGKLTFGGRWVQIARPRVRDRICTRWPT